MQYKKLSALPVLPVPDIQYHNGDRDVWAYRAETVKTKNDGDVLVITIYGTVYFEKWERNAGKPAMLFRHFFTPTAYCTQCKDNHRSNATFTNIDIYGWYGRICSEIDNADDEIKKYFSDNGLKISPEYGNRSILRRSVEDYESAAAARKLEVKHRKETDVIDEQMKLFNGDYPEGFENWLNNSLFKDARYFFYKYRKSKTQLGYCSHCKTEFEAATKHGQSVICPCCKSDLKSSSLGITTKYRMSHRKSAVVLEPHTECNPPVLCIRGYSANLVIENQRAGSEGVIVSIKAYEKKRTLCKLTDGFPYLSDKNGKSNYSYTAYKQTGKIRWCYEEYFDVIKGWIYPGTLPLVVSSCSIEAEKAKQLTVESDTKQLETVLDRLEYHNFNLQEFDNVVARHLIECVKVMDKDTIAVIFEGGFEVRQGL